MPTWYEDMDRYQGYGESPEDRFFDEAQKLASAMSAAFTYEDHDNNIPTLPFVDDFKAFWIPFAGKVLAIQEKRKR